MSQKRMKARFIETVGYGLTVIAMWGKCSHGGAHRAEVELRQDVERQKDPFDDGYRERRDAITSFCCDKCGEMVGAHGTEDFTLTGSYGQRYNTRTGRPEPGDLFYQEQIGFDEPGKCFHHDNCDGRHLVAVLPTGEHWDIDSRANNCTRPDDRLHRCWVREGEPPNITAGKAGNTCSAGAGSIATSNWHGFLRNGEFISC